MSGTSTTPRKWDLVLLAVAMRLLFAASCTLTLMGWLLLGWGCAVGGAAGFLFVSIAWLSDRAKREFDIDVFDVRVRWIND